MRFGTGDESETPELIAYLDAATRSSTELKRATFAAQRLAPGARVLDVGCGTGDDVRVLAELVGPEGFVNGIDANPGMIDEALTRGVPANAAFGVADASALPFDDGSFDAARAERVFQHIADGNVAARELQRVLKTGGRALLLDQDWESIVVAGAPRNDTRAIVRAFVDSLANGWAGRDARALLRGAGFTHVISVPMLAMPPLPQAFDTFLRPAMQAALVAGAIDPARAKGWIEALLAADLRGEFFCSVVTVATIATLQP